MKKLLKDPIIRFLFLGISLFVLWFAVYEWWLHPLEWVDKAVIKNTINVSTTLLQWMGYEVESMGERLIGIRGTPGLFIGDSCNGINLFALYSIFIISFPGKLLSKFIFIPAGIIIIHLLNIFRILFLAIIETYSYAWTEFNHTYTFTLFIYGVIFLLWLFWINRYSAMRKTEKNKHE